jgi:hypothetical protein
MPATRDTQTGTSTRRRRSGTAPHGPPDVGKMAREAVISFLNDASKATADREAARVSASATGAEVAVAEVAVAVTTELVTVTTELEVMPRAEISVVGHVGAESEAWRAAAISVAALDRIEAAAAKVEADIAVALRAYADLQAGAGAAAEAAVHAAQSAMASAGTAVEAERLVGISLRQVRQYVVITVALVIVVIIVLAVATSPVH